MGTSPSGHDLTAQPQFLGLKMGIRFPTLVPDQG